MLLLHPAMGLKRNQQALFELVRRTNTQAVRAGHRIVLLKRPKFMRNAVTAPNVVHLQPNGAA